MNKPRIDGLAVLVVLFATLLVMSLLQNVEAQVYADIGYEDIAVDVHDGFPPAPELEPNACTNTAHWRICLSRFMRMRVGQITKAPEFAKNDP